MKCRLMMSLSLSLRKKNKNRKWCCCWHQLLSWLNPSGACCSRRSFRWRDDPWCHCSAISAPACGGHVSYWHLHLRPKTYLPQRKCWHIWTLVHNCWKPFPCKHSWDGMSHLMTNENSAKLMTSSCSGQVSSCSCQAAQTAVISVNHHRLESGPEHFVLSYPFCIY